MVATDQTTTRSDDALGNLGEVLGHPRRQLTLDALAGLSGDRPSLDAVADAVADLEYDDDRSHRDRVANALHHVHLPKLEELGIVAYDRDAHEVTPDRERIGELRRAAACAAELGAGGA